MSKRMALDWTFEAVLQPHQDELIEVLKPGVTAWANEMWPILRKNLRGDPAAGSSTATEMRKATATRSDGFALDLWVFMAMFVNRDIGDDVVAMVAASEFVGNVMAQSFVDAMQQRLGYDLERRG